MPEKIDYFRLASNGSLILFMNQTDNGPRLFLKKELGRFKSLYGSVDCALSEQEIDGCPISDTEYKIIERWAERFAEFNGE